MKLAWPTRKVLIRGGITLAIVGALIALLYGIKAGNVQPGFGPDETITKSEKRDKQGNIIETTTTTAFQDAKTIWDWLSLLGVPFSLAILGYVLQQLQQIRAEQQAKAEKEIAEANQREEALQNYLDRVAELLIDNNLIAKAVKLQDVIDTQQSRIPTELYGTTLEEAELVNAAVDVLRARTLSILRRLGQDGKRKGDVMRFLDEAEVISHLRLNLSGADLSNADLTNTSIIHADHNPGPNTLLDMIKSIASLDDADLKGVNLSGANLTGANFRNADLTYVNFNGANLSGVNLGGATLTAVQLKDTNLTGAINWTEEELAQATLICNTKLPHGCTLDPNRDCKELEVSPNSPTTPISDFP